MEEKLKKVEDRVDDLETRMAAKDVQFAIINTKLTAILWGLAVVGTAVIGYLVKIVFGT